MWLKIYSDLHNEFGHKFEPQFQPAELRRLNETILVLAGDIDAKGRGMRYAEQYHDIFKAVIFVPGNHDYYGITLNKESTAEKFTSDYENVYSLEYMNEGVVIDGVLFVGGCLWTNLNNGDWFAVQNARQKMNDFVKIKELRRGIYRKLSTDLWMQKHRSCKTKIERELQRTDYEKAVVVTHHAPSYQSVPERYRKVHDQTNYAYMSHIDELAVQADYWIHGHIHDNTDYTIADSVRVLANPRGYIPDYPNDDFDVYGLNIQIL